MDVNHDMSRLREAWAAVAATPGVARSTVAAWVRKPLGPSGMVACFSAQHKALKRPPVAGAFARAPVERPFSAAGFHFGKAAAREVVARFGGRGWSWVSSGGDAGPPAPAPDDDEVWINVSPIWTGHALFTPRCAEGCPQVARPHLFRSVVRLVSHLHSAGGGDDVGGCGFFAGFNSLSAYASVNHFHAHLGAVVDVAEGVEDGALWTAAEGLPCQRAPLVALQPRGEEYCPGQGQQRVPLTVYRLEWPMPAVVLVHAVPTAAWALGEGAAPSAPEREAVADALGSAAGELCAHLASIDMPHNVIFAMTPLAGTAVVAEGGIAAGAAAQRLPGGCLAVYVFPRLHQVESFGGGMGVAMGELAGLAICTEPQTYEEMTEDAFFNELRSCAVPREDFDVCAATALRIVRGAANPLATPIAAPAHPFPAGAELASLRAVFDALVGPCPFAVGRDASAAAREEAREALEDSRLSAAPPAVGASAAATAAAAAAAAPGGAPPSELPDADVDLTYGETPFDTLASALGAIAGRFGGLPPPGEGVFVDVGCGTGKPLFAAALLHPWRTVLGVELVEPLLAEADAMREAFEGGLPYVERGVKGTQFRVPRAARDVAVELVCADATREEGDEGGGGGALEGPSMAPRGAACTWSHADVAYACATCFSGSLLEGVSRIAARMRRGAFFITSSALLDPDVWELLDETVAPMSWGPATIHIHRRK